MSEARILLTLAAAAGLTLYFAPGVLEWAGRMLSGYHWAPDGDSAERRILYLFAICAGLYAGLTLYWTARLCMLDLPPNERIFAALFCFYCGWEIRKTSEFRARAVERAGYMERGR